ncbi:phage tail protein [Rhodobacteraceae bacterium (ex Bugula neritina AB1)]|nr:phage tail protein [Rhodobacteraceae bacterium (ex Bugula neritina AB1)]
MSNMFVMEAVNLFCGDDDPTASKHLTIDELQLPGLQEMFAEHKAGGSRVAIDVPVGAIEKLTAPFKLKGTDPQLMSLFGLGSKIMNNYTAYGVVRDLRSGRAMEAKALMNGRLGKIGADAFKKGDLHGYDYEINAIMHYELFFDGQEKYYFDFFTGSWRVDGNDENADTNQILHIG